MENVIKWIAPIFSVLSGLAGILVAIAIYRLSTTFSSTKKAIKERKDQQPTARVERTPSVSTESSKTGSVLS